MHYKNGRLAKNGDKVVLIPSYGNPVVGILYNAVAGNDFCNGKIAVTHQNDPCPNLKECLHLDDVLAALPENVPDITAPPPTIEELQAILDSDATAASVEVQLDGGVAAIPQADGDVTGLPSAEDLDAVAAEAQLVEAPATEGAAPQPIETEAPAASPTV